MAAALADLPAVKRSAATAAIIAGVQPQLTDRLQGLSGVKGIGRALRGRLYNAGIGTYWELATLPDDELRSILALSSTQLERIKLEDVRADAYSRARETDSVGHIWRGRSVDDFEPFNGIGAVFEERLYEAGIYTYEQLAGATVEQLAEICHAPEMNMPDYADWIAQAKKAVEERQAQVQVETPAEEGEGQTQTA
jgi:predicted flap endonuclease-1-like 5' DNA nuclease